MARHTHLATYINDHLAGAAAAIELMDHVVRDHPDSAAALPLAALKTQIEDERRELESVLKRIGGSRSRAHRAAGWIGERAMELKLRLNDPTDGRLRLFEAVEAISVGVEGKNSLWRVLSSRRGSIPALTGTDYEFFINRGIEQRATLEQLRLTTAADTFEASDAAGS